MHSDDMISYQRTVRCLLKVVPPTMSFGKCALLQPVFLLKTQSFVKKNRESIVMSSAREVLGKISVQD